MTVGVEPFPAPGVITVPSGKGVIQCYPGVKSYSRALFAQQIQKKAHWLCMLFKNISMGRNIICPEQMSKIRIICRCLYVCTYTDVHK